MTCRPGHSPRHPDFEPGNTVALRHGGYSPTLVAADAKELAVQLVEAAPELAAPRYQLELESYCQLVAARRRFARSIAERSAAGETVPPRHYETLATLANSALKIAQQFGLTPAGHAVLMSVVAGTAIDRASSLVDRLADAAKKHAVGATETEGTGGDD